MRILILMSYYNRPILVRNALNSILKANEHHQDWELFFGDDSSDIAGRPIVEEVLKDHLAKVTFAHSGVGINEKIRDGLRLGHYCNEAIRNSDADIAIMFCDDDELEQFYLRNLSNYFNANPNVLYCWSYISLFNPLIDNQRVLQLDNKYNFHAGPINPVGKVDASQVAWRLSCCKHYAAWFAENTKGVSDKPWIKDTDKSFFENLFAKCGLCSSTEFISQFKGVHDYQLLWHKNTEQEGLRAYHDMVKEKAGVLF